MRTKFPTFPPTMDYHGLRSRIPKALMRTALPLSESNGHSSDPESRGHSIDVGKDADYYALRRSDGTSRPPLSSPLSHTPGVPRGTPPALPAAAPVERGER